MLIGISPFHLTLKTSSMRLIYYCLAFVALLLTIYHFKSDAELDRGQVELANWAASIEDSEEMELLMTRDIRTNTVPYERAAIAVKHTMELKRYAARSSSPSLDWMERGPNNVGGRTRAFLFDLQDTTYNTAYASGITGGLWKGTNLRQSDYHWAAVGDFWANINVGALIQDPLNPTHFYVGTGETWVGGRGQGLGIWKSVDNGVTWNQLSSTDNVDFLHVHRLIFDANNHLYACTKDAGLQKSIDGGTTWTKVHGLGFGSTTDLACDIELASNGDLYLSMGGWLDVDTVYRSDYITHQMNTGNAGTWTSIPLPTPHRRVELACAPSDADVLYAIGAGNALVDGIYRSTNRGNTWDSLPLPTVNPGFLLGQPNYNLAIEVDPSRDSTVIIGAVGFFRTLDAGNTWKYNLLGHADNHFFEFIPTHENYSDTIMVCNDGGIYMGREVNTNPLSVRQKSLNNHYNVTQFYGGALNPVAGSDWMIAGAQDNGGVVLSQPGLGPGYDYYSTGTSQFQGDNGFCFIDETDTLFQIIAEKGNTIIYTLDGWSTPVPPFIVRSGGTFINRMDYDQESRKLYSYHSSGKFMRWNDPGLGDSTDIVSIDNATGFLSTLKISPNISNRLYCASSDGNIYRIDDAHTGLNKTGTIIYSGTPNLFISSLEIEEGNEDHMVITYSNYGTSSVWESTNATAANPTWTEIENNLPDMPVRWGIFAPGTNDQFLLATETGVWFTDNLNGTNTAWAPCTDFPTVRTNMLRSRLSDNRVMAVTHGRGIFTSDYFQDCRSVYHITENPTANKNYYATDTISSTSTIAGPWSIEYHSGNVIELRPQFEVQLGAVFQTFNDDCSQ